MWFVRAPEATCKGETTGQIVSACVLRNVSPGNNIPKNKTLHTVLKHLRKSNPSASKTQTGGVGKWLRQLHQSPAARAS